MPDFKTTPMTSNIDTRTGKPSPITFFSLPVKQVPTEISIKYIDRNGTELGPFQFAFEPAAESWKNDIQILQMTKNSWLAFRDFDDKLLLYFTALMSFRGAIETITYGLNTETPDTDYPFPAWEEPGTAKITEEMLPFLSVPKETQFATVQLTYMNGDKSEIVRIER
jgi:hypothetical protein